MLLISKARTWAKVGPASPLSLPALQSQSLLLWPLAAVEKCLVGTLSISLHVSAYTPDGADGPLVVDC